MKMERMKADTFTEYIAKCIIIACIIAIQYCYNCMDNCIPIDFSRVHVHHHLADTRKMGYFSHTHIHIT